MKPAPFAYHRPASIAEAVGLLAALGEGAKVLSGGQSLVPMMNLRIARPEHLVDLNGVAGLDAIRATDTHLEVGALVRHQALATSPAVHAACPLLGEMALTIGHYAIRTRGTLGGSLAHADPAAQLPLAAIALDAQIEVIGPRGQRSIAAGDFFEALMTTALAADELIVAVRFPRQAAGECSAFEQFTRRHGDFALAAATVRVQVHQRRATAIAVAVGGATPVPGRLDDALGSFLGAEIGAELAAQLAAAAAASVEPDAHPRIPVEFRSEVVAAVVRRAASRAMGIGILEPTA